VVHRVTAGDFLYNENPAIVAGFCIGYADEQKTNKESAKNVLVSKAPFTQGEAWDLVPLDRVYVIIAWLAGQ